MPTQRLTLSDIDGVTLTASQGFRAMAKFLMRILERTEGGVQVRTLVGDVEIESDGSSTDPAALSDWAQAVEEVLGER